MNWNEIDQLDQAPDVQVLWRNVLDVLRRQGFDYVIYLTVNNDRSDPFLMTNMPDIYDNVPIHRDPFLDHCCNSYEATFTGPEFFADHPYMDDRELDFVRTAAAKSGFISGIAIPVRLPTSERFGGFNIGNAMKRAAFEQHVDERLEKLRFLSLIIHRRMEEFRQSETEQHTDFRHRLLAPNKAAAECLSPREREVLYLFRQGLTSKECASVCKISPNTVAEYATSAYRKLGVRNRIEALRVLDA